MRSLRLLLVGLTAALFVGSIPSLFAQFDPLSFKDQAIVDKRWPNAKKTITGLRYVITQEGHGAPARPGDVVSVIYRGMLLDGTVFNEFLDPTKPFTFRLGRGQVIDGWDQGLRFMNEGSKMILIVPYELGYGTLGNPPAVPRKSTLVFEIQMLKIQREAPPPPLPPEPKKKKHWWQHF